MELTPVQLNWQNEVVVIGKLIYRPSNCLSGENVFEKNRIVKEHFAITINI